MDFPRRRTGEAAEARRDDPALPGADTPGTPAADPGVSAAHVARTECIGFVLEQGVVGSLTVAIVASLYALTIWHVIEQPRILGWLAATLLAGLLRIGLQWRWHRRGSASGPERPWALVALAAGVLSGASWGFAATLLFPAGQPALYLIALLILIGMPAGALSSFAAWFPAYAGYIAASVGPFALAAFAGWNGQHWIGGVGAVVFGGFLLREAWATSASMRRNVVQRIELEALTRSLAEARDAAEAASRAKSSFLANMSHELRTPLTAVIGMTDLIVRDDDPAQTRHFAAIAGQSARSLLSLINEVLDLSRIEAGRLELQPEPVRLRALAGEVETMFRPEADRKGLALRFLLDPGLPVVVRADPLRLRQVIVNLVGNALKFTDAGSVTVSVDAVPRADGRTTLRIAVRDTGIGIPVAAQSRLFRPFSQVHEPGPRQYGGSGLGLGISREIVTAMGGRIGVESTAGEGSTFRFEVPADVLPDTALPEPVAPSPGGSLPAQPMRVLVVDDNAVNLMLATRLLTALGCEVSRATSGTEALAQLEATGFDLVFMDSQMPGMDGITATRLWRERERSGGRQVPIVALTASAMAGDREAFLAAGMDDYVSKPFGIDDLRQVLERFSGGRDAAAPAATRRAANA